MHKSTYHHDNSINILAVEVHITRYCQSCIKYPQPASAISPTAHSPIQPQNVRHSGVTSSSGNTKFTTSTPVILKLQVGFQNPTIFITDYRN